MRGRAMLAAGLAAAVLATVGWTGTPAQAVTTTATKTATVDSSRPTGWAALDKAISRIPSYRAHAVSWVVSDKYGYWGTADWYSNVIYVSPDVPADRLYDVAVHEWSHELSALAYGGNVRRAKRAMNRFFGGRHLVGAERAADCMALVQGAQWTHYTTCRSVQWRHGARRLVNGRHLRIAR